MMLVKLGRVVIVGDVMGGVVCMVGVVVKMEVVSKVLVRVFFMGVIVMVFFIWILV